MPVGVFVFGIDCPGQRVDDLVGQPPPARFFFPQLTGALRNDVVEILQHRGVFDDAHQPLYHDLRDKGFADKIFGTLFKAADLIFVVIHSGQEDNRNAGGLGVLFKLCICFKSIHLWHLFVEQDQIGGFFLCQQDPVGAGLRRVCFKAVLPQYRRSQVAGDLVIVDDQYPVSGSLDFFFLIHRCSLMIIY